MNYRHAFHAGNFADVLKHAVLVLVLEHLRQKATPFRVIDTHAGIGAYDLADPRAARTGEWRDGIGRLLGPEAPPLPEPVARVLKRYLDLVRSENPGPDLVRYPGSPRIARAMLRPCDALVVNELHSEDQIALKRLFARDPQTRVMGLDGWVALKALLPPKERRGLVLVDPPFEDRGELARLTEALVEATKRFAAGVYMLWYPIKDVRAVNRFHRVLTATGLRRLLKIELMVRSARRVDQLNGSGLILHNPPYRLDETLRPVLAALADRLEQGPGASGTVSWLVQE